jgi:hypothetical protein
MRGRRLFAAIATVGAVCGLVVVGAVTGTSTAGAVTPTQPGALVAVTPANLLDTGTGVGAPATPVAANSSVTFQVSGRGGVPSSGAGSVELTIAVVAPAASGFATVYPAGVLRPLAASLDFTAKQTIANSSVVGLGSGTGNDGKVTIFNGSNAAVRLVANVSGYYLAGTAATGGAFTAVTPANVLDTGTGVGAPVGAVPANGSVTFHVSGQGGVPATGAGAVALVVAAVAPAAAGFATVYPAGTTRPAAAALDFTKGQTIANLTEVGLGGGDVTIFNGSASPLRLVANVLGYYQAGPPTLAGMFSSVQPANLLDTGTGVGAPKTPVPANGSVTIQVAGRGGVPTGAGAVALTVAAVSPTSTGFVTVYPAGVVRPGAAGLDFTSGQTIAGLVVVGMSADGKVTLFNGSSSPLRLVANVTGYWLNGPDTAAPSPVSDLTSTALSATSVQLLWHNPSDPDFAGVKVCTSNVPSCSGTTLPATATSYVASSLAAGTAVTYTVFALDAAGNVSPGSTTTVSTQASGNTASISGSVTDVTTPKHPLGSVVVRVYTTTATPVAGAVTATDGTYSVGGLAAGTYKVCFDGRFATGGGSSTGLYQDRCYNNIAWPTPSAGAPSGATAVTLAAGGSSTGVNAALAAAGAITGTVTEANSGTALGNVQVFAYVVGGTASSATSVGLTAADGTYIVRHLPPAANGYIVCFGARNAVGPPSPLGYADRCYKDFQWDQTVASPFGNAVFVGSGTAPTGATDGSAAITPGIDASLPRAAVLSGTVTAGGSGAGNVPVSIWDLNGRVIARATTQSDGTWQAFPVSPGTVLVCFDATNITSSQFGYQSQCYNAQPWDGVSSPRATGITLNAGTVVTGINATLATFPAITGTVVDKTNPTFGIFNVTVKLFNSSGVVIKTTTTFADGTYALTHLAQGAYFVCFDGSTAATQFLDQCYNGAAWDGVAKPSAATHDTLFGLSGVKTNVNGSLTPKP